ncbi:hypothetical protein ABH920_009392 [Catenulispora sp. EB89]|uniref:hypothetical protein n=1 Tax=Catenulispora sp. EB89 TaxID=3156257 RepID=UPI00351117C4
MATLRAVVEIEPWADADDAPWPIASTDTLHWDVLDGATAPATIGTVMAALAKWCRPEDADTEPTATEALRWIATSDHLVIAGGIHAADAETAVHPGCCADLEGWRAWPDTWLGHPTPAIERTADGITIRQDRGSQNAVTLATDALPGLLAALREDLIDFLAAVEHWAADTGADAELAAAVVANIDRHMVIRAPLADG